MFAQIVHYAVLTRDEGVAPLCGDWGAGTSWTTIANAVCCARCGSRLRAGRPPRPASAPEACARPAGNT